MKNLQQGISSANNLAEILKIHHPTLLKNVLENWFDASTVGSVVDAATAFESLGISQRMRQMAHLLLQTFPEQQDFLAAEFTKHPSDTVRGWGCYMSAQRHEAEPIDKQLEHIKPYAIDAHFGVREWAWLALRDSLTIHLEEVCGLYTTWVQDSNLYVRRFAIESIRPRGVWSKHIEVLKINPSMALPLLEPLRAEPEKYVQDSVANWLNDASKSSPDWVTELCQRWQTEHSPVNKHTARMIKRALRTINK